MSGQQIDREKLRDAIRRMGSDYLFLMLDAAITVLPQDSLHTLVKGFLNPGKLRPDRVGETSLLEEIESFRKASMARKYYEDFAVNSRNCTTTSGGTLAWMADCHRLLDSCVAQVEKGDLQSAYQAFEIIFDLLDRIDDGNDEILFFADEGGSWAVGIEWERVLPAWFKALAAEAAADEYAMRVAVVLRQHCNYAAGRLLATASRAATAAQRQALPENEQALSAMAREYVAKKRAAEKARREREAAAERQRYLATLWGHESELWERIGNLISGRKPKEYDEAMALLADLRDLYNSAQDGTDFQIRLAALREDHRNKRRFLRRLSQAGL
jgi:cell division septum initiation protein DivIVA